MRSHLSNTLGVSVTDDMGSQAAMETSGKYIASGYLNSVRSIIARHFGFTLQAMKLHIPLCA